MRNESANLEFIKIKELLRHEPKGMSISEISRELKLNRNSVAKYVNMLHISGHVEMRSHGPAKVYYLSYRVPLSAMMDFSSDYIIVIDDDMQIIQANDNFLSLINKKREEVVGQNILESDMPIISDQNLLSRIISGTNKNKIMTEICWMKDDDEIYFNVKSIPTVFDNGKPALTMIAENITQKKKDEIQLKSSLKEKEELLREVHQRIRDNLQLISSILNLQASASKDIKVLDNVRASQNRIAAMTYVYENLHQNDDLTNIQMSDYIRNLVGDIRHTYDMQTGNIWANIIVDDILIDADTAIYCGLIINELVSNSLKYAFSDIHRGEINIIMKKVNLDKIKLIISDNGIGLPADFDIETTECLGISLVRTIAIKQLNGTLELNQEKGVKFTITFKQKTTKGGEI